MILAVKSKSDLVTRASQLLLRSLLFFVVCAFSACGKQPEITSLSGLTMGTAYNVKIVLPNEVNAENIKESISLILNRVDGLMSTYDDSSEVSRFNRLDPEEWMAVSEETWQVVTISKEISDISQGAFDITVAPLVLLWGFGPADKFKLERAVPSEKAIHAALAGVGMDAIELRSDPFVLKKTRFVTIDLSAVAKGFGVDLVVDYLNEQGVESALVEVGGEVRTIGVKPNGSPWVIGIEKPVSGRGQAQVALAIKDIAIATSGDYRNYYEVDDKRYSHTIDPRSGQPISHGLASVTVLSKTTARADALATAINVMGPEIGFQFAKSNEIAAYFIIKEISGFRVSYTELFEQYLH